MKVFRVAVCVLVVLAGSVIFAEYSRAQSTDAAVSGQITDSSGRVVPGAAVVLTNLNTNFSYTTRTNREGIYRFADVQPGIYRANVTKDGFASIVKGDIEIHVQDQVSINFALRVGSVSEVITVEAGGGSMINMTDASVSTIVDQSYVANMPLNGRSFQDLILLTPGVVTQTPQSPGTQGASGEFSVNGQRTESNYYTVDGVSANIGSASGGFSGYWNTSGGAASGSVPGSTALGTTQALVSVDDLQEFRVESSTYSAEYGRNPGAQISFETKSGTNQWHGTASDYLRNGYVDAQDWFNDYLGVKEPAVRQNDFGGTLGGALRKDKTFFFASYEGLRLSAPQPATTNLLVPDSCLRDASTTCDQGVSAAPAELLPVLNAYSLPNGPEFYVPCDPTSGDPNCPTSGPLTGQEATGLAHYVASWANPSSINSTSIRFDHVVKDKLRLFFRFSNTTSNSGNRGSFGFGNLGPSVNTTDGSTVRTYTAGATSLLSSRVINDARLNYSSNESIGNSAVSPFGGSMPVDMRPASGLGAGSSVNFCIFTPNFTCVGINQEHWSGAQQQWNLVDTVSFSFGRHQLKFGMDFRRLAPNSVLPPQNVGYDYFDHNAVQANSAFALIGANNPAYPLYKNFAAFAQDEWRITPRLSLSMGLRWEVNPPPSVTQGLMPYTVTGNSLDSLIVAPQGTPLWQTTWYNVSPRLGAAYVLRGAPGWETVIRGGGGVFFDSGQQDGSLGFGGPGFVSLAFVSGSYNVSGSWTADGVNFAATPAALIPPIDNPPVSGNGGYSYPPTGFYPRLQLPYTLHWNMTIEQALGKSQALTVSYLGDHGARLLQDNRYDTPNNPNSTIFFIVQNGLTSDYDALQAQLQRRLSDGLTVLGSYTWSHCLDYGSSNAAFGFKRGNCDYDVRHNFSGAFSYSLPNVGHGGFVSGILSHWGVDDRFTARTAFPITLYGNGFTGPDGKHYNGELDFVPGQPVYLYGANCASVLQAAGELQPNQACPGGKAINPNAFTPNVASPTGFGNSPRNFARLFGAWQMDLAVRREFPITERLKMQFRAEAFNILNHPNFGTVDSYFGDPSFGLATGTLASALHTENSLYQLGGPRSMQFALKLIF